MKKNKSRTEQVQMKLLGIDPGVKSCGVCVIDSDGRIIHHNTIDISSDSYEKGLWEIHKSFVEIIKCHHVGIVACEYPMFARFHSKSLGRLMMVLSQAYTASYGMDVDIQTYKCSEWRKIVGLKKAKDWKEPAVEYCEFWTGKRVCHDVAEAYCIARACMQEYKEAMYGEETE